MISGYWRALRRTSALVRFTYNILFVYIYRSFALRYGCFDGFCFDAICSFRDKLKLKVNINWLFKIFWRCLLCLNEMSSFRNIGVAYGVFAAPLRIMFREIPLWILDHHKVGFKNLLIRLNTVMLRRTLCRRFDTQTKREASSFKGSLSLKGSLFW